MSLQLLQRFFVLCFPEAAAEVCKEEDPRWREVGFQVNSNILLRSFCLFASAALFVFTLYSFFV